MHDPVVFLFQIGTTLKALRLEIHAVFVGEETKTNVSGIFFYFLILSLFFLKKVFIHDQTKRSWSVEKKTINGVKKIISRKDAASSAPLSQQMSMSSNGTIVTCEDRWAATGF